VQRGKYAAKHKTKFPKMCERERKLWHSISNESWTDISEDCIMMMTLMMPVFYFFFSLPPSRTSPRDTPPVVPSTVEFSKEVSWSLGANKLVFAFNAFDWKWFSLPPRALNIILIQ
jgi:hypothetical protein